MENKLNKPYWTLLILIAAFFLLSGYREITKNPVTYMKTLKMGFPSYFIMAWGISKLFGVIALLQPWCKKLKEWAFAGFTFDVIFAFISGQAIESYSDCFKSGFVFILLMAACFLYWKKTLRIANQSNCNNTNSGCKIDTIIFKIK